MSYSLQPSKIFPASLGIQTGDICVFKNSIRESLRCRPQHLYYLPGNLSQPSLEQHNRLEMLDGVFKLGCVCEHDRTESTCLGGSYLPIQSASSRIRQLIRLYIVKYCQTPRSRTENKLWLCSLQTLKESALWPLEFSGATDAN